MVGVSTTVLADVGRLLSIQEQPLKFQRAGAETKTAALTPVTTRYSEPRKRVPDCALLCRSSSPCISCSRQQIPLKLSHIVTKTIQNRLVKFRPESEKGG